MSSSKSTAVFQDPADSTQAHELVSYLNELIQKLGIPITIETPYELTPSLLLAVLECITRQRLPIPLSTRRARDGQSKVQAMKIFLGVLESDVLQENVGLSDVDPRRLATGEWDEVVFVGEVLCWLGKVYGFIPQANVPDPRATRADVSEESAEASWQEHESFHPSIRHPRAPSPSNLSSATTRNSMNSSLSMMHSGPAAATDTTVLSVAPEPEPSLSELDLFDAPSRIGRYATSTPPPPTHSPRCIHEVDDPSFLARDASASLDDTRGELGAGASSEDASTFCDCPSDPESPLARFASRSSEVRRSGWIEQADDEAEARSFIAAKARTAPARATRAGGSPRTADYPFAVRTPTPTRHPGRVITRHTSPTEYTLALLNERAKLMEELASMKAASRMDTPTRRRY